MAKQLLTTYTFTPGAANAGTVVVPGTYALEQFLLVTNVTTGATIYQFNKPTKGGTVSTGGGNTTLTLEADTSSMSSGDRLQVFVDITVDGPLTDAQLRASAVPISAGSLPLPTGAATESTIASIDSKTPALQSGRVPVDIGSASVTITGPVTVANEVEVTNDTGNPIPTSVASMPEGHGSLRDVITLLDILLSRQAFPDSSGRLQVNLVSYPSLANVSGGTPSQPAIHTGHIGGFQANLDQVAKTSTAAAVALRANITVS